MPATNQPYTLIECLFHQAKKNPTHQAIATPTFTLTYAQLSQLVQLQIKQYTDTGITNDSIIGIKCADDTKHLLLCLAATQLGVTTCTIPSYEAEAIQNTVIDNCKVTHVVDEKSAVEPTILSHNISVASMNINSLDASLLFSTSGTTGKPKLVIHHDSDLVAQAHRHIGSEHERFACVASIEQNFAKRHRLYCLAVGATNIFLNSHHPSFVSQCLSLHVNVLHVSAFQAQELLATPEIALLSNIRLKLGGSHVSLSLRQQLHKNITRNLQAGYGTTETGAISFTDPHDQNAGESVGKPLPGIEIRIVSTNRTALDVGERGELAIRCKGMFRGYLGNAKLTKTRLADGWFYTGDIGYIDAQQRIHLSGRFDDMFLFNSMNIYPQEIESQICKFPGVIDAAVLPKTSSTHDNIPVALIVFSKDIKPDLSKLKKFVRKQIGLRSPRQFTVVSEIPRNNVGKISRKEAVTLSIENEQIRNAIVQALSDTGAIEQIDSSLITAFKEGDRDIRLNEIGIDSLTRMELMIAMEIEFDTIIMPHEFPQLRTLNDIVLRVLNPPIQNESKQDNNSVFIRTIPSLHIKTPPFIVRFFQRIFSYCHTASHLNKALTTLESRLTPTDIECLHDWHLKQQLIPANTAIKFHTILNAWLHGMKRMMSGSGKLRAEPFISHKITLTATHFVGQGEPADKTLVICFSTRGSRCLMMPNAVLMQHTDSSRYDLLVISEPLNENYQKGVPSLGNNLIQVIKWLATLKLISDYRSIRTLGCSAGGYAAMAAAHYLKADIAVSVGGRFPSKHKHPIIFLNMIFTKWRVMRTGHCPRVLMSYGANKSRDRKFAKIMARLFGSTPDIVQLTNEEVGHNILGRLVERQELTSYLDRTIFMKID